MNVGAIAKGFFGNPFSASITFQQRANILALQQGGMKVLGASGESEGGTLSTIDSLIKWSSLALLIPGIAATPIGAAIFAANVVSALINGAGYAKNFLGSLFSLDFMGMITNGLAFAGCAITALPCGKLFSKGFGTAYNMIKNTASKMPGGLNASNCFRVGSGYLYGGQFSNNLTKCGQYVSGLRSRIPGAAPVAAA